MDGAPLFTIDPAPTFVGEARITGPGGEARPLRLRFRAQSRSALKAWLTRARELPEGTASEAQALAEVIDGWEGVDAQYDLAALTRLLDNHFQAGHEIMIAYLDGLSGARTGN